MIPLKIMVNVLSRSCSICRIECMTSSGLQLIEQGISVLLDADVSSLDQDGFRELTRALVRVDRRLTVLLNQAVAGLERTESVRGASKRWLVSDLHLSSPAAGALLNASRDLAPRVLPSGESLRPAFP